MIGQAVEACNWGDFKHPVNTVLIATIDGASYPYICVDTDSIDKYMSNEPFNTMSVKYIRERRKVYAYVTDVRVGDEVFDGGQWVEVTEMNIGFINNEPVRRESK